MGDRKSFWKRLFSRRSDGSPAEQRRFETAAVTLKAIGKAADAERLGDEAGEHLGASDTCLSCAQLCVHLAAIGRSHEVYLQDPEFDEGVRQKAAHYAGRAREGYRRHVEAANLSPDDPELLPVLDEGTVIGNSSWGTKRWSEVICRESSSGSSWLHGSRDAGGKWSRTARSRRARSNGRRRHHRCQWLRRDGTWRG